VSPSVFFLPSPQSFLSHSCVSACDENRDSLLLYSASGTWVYPGGVLTLVLVVEADFLAFQVVVRVAVWEAADIVEEEGG